MKSAKQWKPRRDFDCAKRNLLTILALMQFLPAPLFGLLLACTAWAALHAETSPQRTRDARNAFAEVRANQSQLRLFLRRMPKGAELHTHLSGTPAPDRLLSLAAGSTQFHYFAAIPDRAAPEDPHAFALVAAARSAGVPAKPGFSYVPVDTLLAARTLEMKSRLAQFRQAHLINQQDQAPLTQFYGTIFQRRAAVVNNQEIIPSMVQDLVAEARKHRISYVEVQVSPFPSDPAAKPGENERATNVTSAREFLTRLAGAAETANKSAPTTQQVDVRFVLGFLRTNARLLTALPIAFELASGSDSVGRSIAGINLVGNEYSEDNKAGAHLAGPEHIRDYLLTLRRAYPRVRVALHAGETTKWDWHIRDSLLAGAERIGHATNLELSPDGADLELFRRSAASIEACPTSNRLLLGVPVARHPLLNYIQAGIPVSISTDDAGIFETDMTEEFARIAESMPALTWDHIKRLARGSLEQSFAEESRKQALLKRFDAEMAEFEESKDWSLWLRPMAGGGL